MLKLDKKIFGDLAKKYGTPLYIYDKQKIESNYLRLIDSFQTYYQNTKIHFSVKSNSNLNILKLFHSLGAGADCSSPMEVLLAERAGIPTNNIVYTGNYESFDDLAQIYKKNLRLNLDDRTSMERLIEVGKRQQIAFRINPGIGRGGFEGIVTAGSDAKFGIPYEKAIDAYRAARDAGFKKFGIHMMTGSNNLEPYYFAEIVARLMNIAGEIFGELGVKPEYIDIGGGFGVPYNNDEEELNIELTAKSVCDIFKERCAKYKLGKPDLILEPGRYLIANSGYILSRVTGIKKSYKKFIGLDAGMNTLIRPALYGAKHRIEALVNSSITEFVNVCGQICENSDIQASHIELPVLEVGDLVLIHDAGAYGYVMSSNYNNRFRPAELLIDHENVELIRRRETAEDLLRLYEF
ncbi:MAG: diaminopimelate decarboxylase [Candidatus Kapabacteria bacterium]|nr:diaminopimelate decarboxylase [Candidatus Kapabacteria bacterium]